MFSSVEDALSDYSKGKLVIVVDDENRETMQNLRLLRK